MNELESAVKNALEDWVNSVVEKLKRQLDRNKIAQTGELRNSVKAQFAYEQGKLSAKVFFEYAIQGKYQDFKSWNFTQYPDVEAIEKWVKSVGVGKFAFVPSYQNTKTLPTNEQAAKRIAWGIASKWEQVGKVTRKRRWRPLKTVYNTLPSVREMIAQKVQEFGYESIEKALNSLNLS